MSVFVSILVLMDGVLRVQRLPGLGPLSVVSILVLMDGVLRAGALTMCHTTLWVSILVLMDGVLREVLIGGAKLDQDCFNPCSNGWCTSSYSP